MSSRNLHVALLWHQHQPIYKESSTTTTKGRYRAPWVRLHALRDYYSMAALVDEFTNVRLTINLTPALLSQIEDYVHNGSTDEALELTLKPAAALDALERDRLLSTFFDVSWENQILVHARYAELFQQRAQGQPFSNEDFRDLQAWFNLAWFGKEFRDGDVVLVTGDRVSVRELVAKGRGFTPSDIETIVAEQYKILRAVLPMHRDLQDRGKIEVSTTPFYHPILPLLVDTDRATIDLLGTTHPTRFACAEDARLQVALARASYERWFHRAPSGMWPAEGAVAQFVLPLFADQGIEWIASDAGVLARSGKWGYRTEDPNVLARAYRAEEGESQVAIFFRDRELSDDIGFRCHREADPANAARAWVERMKDRFGHGGGEHDRIVTVVLDGENAWGSYRDDGRPFLRALYGALEGDVDITTVTFREYLHGKVERGVAEHEVRNLDRVYELFTGSWIDEAGSDSGVDLGTWIGEPEENHAWELLARVRSDIESFRTDEEHFALAQEAVLAAEGSDWFWWFGADQDSERDSTFDELFRLHLTNAYRALGAAPPAELRQPIARLPVVWALGNQVERVSPRDVLSIRINCPGVLQWAVDEEPEQEQRLRAVGGVMAGAQRHEINLGPFGDTARVLRFRFRCTHEDDDRVHPCCRLQEYAVRIGEEANHAS